MFSVKHPNSLDLRSRVVYKFTCAGCNACYIGETSRHLSTRVREHLSRDRKLHIFQHLQLFYPGLRTQQITTPSERSNVHQMGESYFK